MFRASRPVALAAALGAAAAVQGDELAAYLEQHGLSQLLAVHLEQQLESREPRQRDDLVLRLAAIYAQLLETVDDPAQRMHLEERSRRLLALAPADSTDELRLALLRGSYRTAEKIAENHRLRLCSDQQIAAAIETLTDIIPRLNQLRGQIDDQAKIAERRLSRSGGTEAVARAEAAERYRRLSAQVTFLTAWALYYQSWLNDRPDNARVAERLFAQLLDAEQPHPQPEDISEDLRSVEAVARSILGLGLCKSLTASSVTAVRWIELLNHPQAYGPLQEQVPAWEIAVYLEHEQFRSARDVLEAYVDAGGSPPLVWLRLVAVHALEAVDRDRDATELVRFAVTELAGRGELQQILDLANRYGAERLGGSGFALQYVKGALAYHRAREAHGRDQPIVDAGLASLYEQAVTELHRALEESDAGRYPVAVAASRRLIAWCLYFQGRFGEARDAFELASTRLGDDEAPEALWMAIVCQDKLVTANHRPALAAQLAELIDRFLARFPSSAQAPKLILKRALSAERGSPEDVARLLKIPPHSEVYGAARQHAAEILYRLFRESSGERRVAYGGQYLAVAVPLLAEDRLRGDVADPGACRRHLARCRRILEVALGDSMERLVAARAAFEAVGELHRRRPQVLAAHADEINYRRVQEGLLRGDPDRAETIADQLWAVDRDGAWSQLAARAIFKYALDRWHSRETGPSHSAAVLDLVVRHGGRVLREYDDDPGALDRPSVLAYHAAVAEAALEIWERTNDQTRGRAALFLYEKLLGKRPRAAKFLRATGLLSERLGNPEQALACWRTLVAGSDVGTDRWYEAKFHVISLLLSTDPDRARAVIDQHKRLHPEYGPEPWGSRLRGLDARIRRAESARSSPALRRPAGAALEQVHSRCSGWRPLGPADTAARPYQSEGWPGRAYGALETALGAWS